MGRHMDIYKSDSDMPSWYLCFWNSCVCFRGNFLEMGCTAGCCFNSTPYCCMLFTLPFILSIILEYLKGLTAT